MSKSVLPTSEKPGAIASVERRAFFERLALGAAAFAGIASADVSAASSVEPQDNLQPLAAGKIRRVVAGTKPNGKSFIVSDTVLPTTGTLFLWTSDAKNPLGAGAPDEIAFTKSPSELWSRCYLASLEPNKDPKPTRENLQGFHINPVRGIVYVFVLSGSITYLTDLDEALLKPGDVLVMRDNRHSWRNDGTAAVKIFVAAHAIV